MRHKLCYLFVILLLIMAAAGCRKEKDPSKPVEQVTVDADSSDPSKKSDDNGVEGQTTNEPLSEMDSDDPSEIEAESNENDDQGMQIVDNYEIEIKDNQGVGGL